MLRLAGPRFLLYGLFIGAVAAAAALSHLGTGGIVVAMAATWLLLSALEWAVSRAVAPADDEVEEEEDPFRARPAPTRAAWPPPAPQPLLPEAVAVPAAAVEPVPEPAAPEPAPELVQESGVPPEVPPPVAIPEPQQPPAEPAEEPPAEPHPEPVAAPAPEPAPQPLAAVAPQPEPAPTPPVAPSVPVLPVGGRGGREWNLWDLERLTRDAAGRDAFKDEERAYLLMYLREFANADGILPADFDGLIRDSFGDLVGVS